MPRAKEMLRRALQRCGPGIGRSVRLTGATGTTAVSADMATGSISNNRFRNHYLLRLDAASEADHIRICTAFDAATGTFTHDGPAYSDVTASGETLDIIHPAIDPWALLRSIQEAVQRTRRIHVSELMSHPAGLYWLPWEWVESPSDIHMVTYRPSPVMSRNRRMEQWGEYASDGTLLPDWWSVTGSGASMTRAGGLFGRHAVAITRSGADARLSQEVALPDIPAATLSGRTVTIAASVRTTLAGAVRAFIDTGATVTSAAHSGSGKSEELTVEVSLPSGIDAFAFGVVVTADGQATVDDCYAVLGKLTDAIREDAFAEHAVRPRYFQSSPLSMALPGYGYGGQFRVYTVRSYPAFHPSRVEDRSFVNDDSDAPVFVAALGVASFISRMMAEEAGQDTELHARKAAQYTAEFDREALRHIGAQAAALKGAVSSMRARQGVPVRRFG